MDNPVNQPIIQMMKRDMQTVLAQLHLSLNPMSPLNRILAGTQAAPSLSNDISTALSQPDFQQIAAIAAGPDLVVNCRIGGGSVDLQEIKLCRCRTFGDRLILIVEVNDRQLAIWNFADPAAFLDWLIGQYAGRNAQTTANYIPPMVDLGEFLYILHAIDAFRIASFKGMLSYAAGQQPSLSMHDFMEAMRQSVRSKDIRWLLPAFLILTPGLDPQSIDLSAEKTAALFDRGFLAMSKNPVNQNVQLTFGEAGQAMGVEFYRTWLLSIGLEILVAAPTGIQAVNRLFLAPTALANHLVLMDPLSENPEKINHQALSIDQLENKLQQVFLQALALESVSPCGQQPQAAAATAVPTNQPRFCMRCGAQVSPGVKFCSKCGAKF